MEKRCVFLSYIKEETMWVMGSVLELTGRSASGNTRLCTTHQRKQQAADRSMPRHLWMWTGRHLYTYTL